jgi:uncharacterized protein (TIGR02466 family)
MSIMTFVETLKKAFQFYQAGDYHSAASCCDAAAREIARPSPDVLRLTAMIHRKTQNFVAAEQDIQKSLQIGGPNDEGLNVLGLIYLNESRFGEAAAAFTRALQVRPGYAPALVNLARAWTQSGQASQAIQLLRSMIDKAMVSAEIWTVFASALKEAGRDEEQAEALKNALKLDGKYVPAIRGLAHVYLQSARSEMVLELVQDSAGDAELEFLRLQALFDSQRTEEALDIGRKILRTTPEHVRALRSCAQMLWMTDRGAEIGVEFEQALSRSQNAETVYHNYMKTLIQMQDFDAAIEVGTRALKQHGRTPQIAYLMADALIESGDGERALDAAEFAASSAPQSPALACNWARALLMTERGSEALGVVEQARKLVPDNQFWIAIEATALRQIADPAYSDLMNYEAFARPFFLDAPNGYSSMNDLNADLLRRLLELHQFAQCPLDQSLRLGSQTSMDIKSSDEPVFKAFFEAIKDPIADYISAMKTDQAHPLLSRKQSAFQLSGAWSVKLGPAGNHVSHVHPEGWISSAYYVDVPEQVKDSKTREGWLKFGEPPFKVPGAETAQHYIEPAAGCLALFPSYMWHGTVPISKGVRVTIAYDVVPR